RPSQPPASRSYPPRRSSDLCAKAPTSPPSDSGAEPARRERRWRARGLGNRQGGCASLAGVYIREGGARMRRGRWMIVAFVLLSVDRKSTRLNSSHGSSSYAV